LVKDGTLLTKTENDSLSGLVLLEKDPMFVSCHPILTTNSKGPVKGTLIFGKYFDNALLTSFEETTCYSLKVYRVDKKIPDEVQPESISFSDFPDKPVIKPYSSEEIAGFFKLEDIS